MISKNRDKQETCQVIEKEHMDEGRGGGLGVVLYAYISPKQILTEIPTDIKSSVEDIKKPPSNKLLEGGRVLRVFKSYL